LNQLTDREIIDKIVFDSQDFQMINALKPSLEEGIPIQTQDDALSYIGSRGHASATSRQERINYARRILQEDFLPHVSTSAGHESLKAYFIGYMVFRLINASLGRAPEDDRDHYGKKRLDMAGSLLGSLFHNLFREFIKEARRDIQRTLNKRDAT
jgi:DNA-directed RNA polymerase II subunit RPB2